MVGEQLQICCFNNCDDRGKQCQSHHNANAQSGRKWHLQFQKCRNWYNGQNYICHSCICADQIGEVIENIRAPTCALNGSVPRFFRGFTLKEYNENRYHGQYNLENDHGIQESCTKWVGVKKMNNENRNRDVGEAKRSYISLFQYLICSIEQVRHTNVERKCNNLPVG